MMAETADLIEMAEALPIDEKAMLVDRLLDSMYPRQAEIDELWKVEVERRAQSDQAGDHLNEKNSNSSDSSPRSGDTGSC